MPHRKAEVYVESILSPSSAETSVLVTYIEKTCQILLNFLVSKRIECAL